MATAKTGGVDYFPMNTDFFEDDKIQLIEAEHGDTGALIAVKLLCKIYSEGPWYKWGPDESLLFARKFKNSSPEDVEKVIASLMKRDFLSAEKFTEHKILTSAGIQRRFFDIVHRRKKVDVPREFLLTDVSEVLNVNILDSNVDILSLNVDAENQRKEKKRKEKKSKGENARAQMFTECLLYLKKNKMKYFPIEFQKARDEILKYQNQHEITPEKIASDEAIRLKWEAADAEIFQRRLGSVMEKEIEKCYNYYAKKDFRIDGNTIKSWLPVLASWMDRRDEFKKIKA